MAERVDMRPAYHWTCPECGTDHFERSIVAEFSPEDRIEQARHMGMIDDWEVEIPEDLKGDFQSYPDAVTCPDCGREWETKHYSQEDESDDDQ